MAKAFLRGMFYVINVFTKKKISSKQPTLNLKRLEKEQTWSNDSRRKKRKIRAEKQQKQ